MHLNFWPFISSCSCYWRKLSVEILMTSTWLFGMYNLTYSPGGIFRTWICIIWGKSHFSLLNFEVWQLVHASGDISCALLCIIPTGFLPLLSWLTQFALVSTLPTPNLTDLCCLVVCLLFLESPLLKLPSKWPACFSLPFPFPLLASKSRFIHRGVLYLLIRKSGRFYEFFYASPPLLQFRISGLSQSKCSALFLSYHFALADLIFLRQYSCIWIIISCIKLGYVWNFNLEKFQTPLIQLQLNSYGEVGGLWVVIWRLCKEISFLTFKEISMLKIISEHSGSNFCNLIIQLWELSH